jgi:hypothetical protein
MLVTKRYTLVRFPVVVDPVVQVLEVELVELQYDAAGVATRSSRHWKPLQRLRVSAGTFPFSIDNSMIHFFGLEAKVEHCPFLLIYDALGVLRYKVDRTDDGDYETKRIPEELNGAAVVSPSVRLSFKDMDDANRFLALVQARQEGGAPDEGEETLLSVLLKEVVDVHLTHTARAQ